MLLPARSSYPDTLRHFEWQIPFVFNIGEVVSDAWAAKERSRVCLQRFSPDGRHLQMTYGELSDRSSSLANGLRSLGVRRGDRVALLLPQGFDTVVAHVAIYKLGAIALPLALLFGEEALEYRLQASGACAIVTNAFGLSRLDAIGDEQPALQHVLLTEPVRAGDGCISFHDLIAQQPPSFEAVQTGPDDPALMIFTSGTTGPPKAALHGHRVLAGHLPGFQFGHDFAPQDGDRIWTPADWAWAGGLLNVLLPALMLGIPVVSSPAQKFDPHMAFRIISEMEVRNAFIPPTALRLMKAVENPRLRYGFRLRTVASAGESLGRDTCEWAREALGVAVNELYGQTECNFVLGSCGALGVSRPGSIGREVPGHVVEVLDEAGNSLPAGAVGEIAVRSPDPVMFLGYWNDPDATAEKVRDGWLRTGDLGRKDSDGFIAFVGRDDDVITSSGYRIGPGEIEDCLVGHAAVRLAAVVGKPDPLRTEIVKAFVVLQAGYLPSEELAAELRDWVKHRLSMHEYPREVAFVDELPLTTTSKVIRRLLRERAAAE
ncbi:AMP-dependent synthetase [Pseudorhizobium endolithicum]|uniref:AMP-dependent synthetase n=1 Tax=Pseudorhizobium endolithicum TaxID=1191678 RepID=A0ABN7JJQ6_9HYPH|nr:AMP-binding protein [Pseudorhizobium endolithicum]CAD7034622.1 AMP-dependent synthetase [Pseudorhizobium endolithicum]